MIAIECIGKNCTGQVKGCRSAIEFSGINYGAVGMTIKGRGNK